MSQQLVKKGTNGKHENVMPRSWIEAIKDKNTGQTLVEILQGFNMYFLPYNGNTTSTRCLVPTMLRKKGLWITYVKYDGNVYTEWYAAEQIDDNSWGDSSNWRIGNNTLVGDITISANGNWVINGTETEFKAIGEKGNTPLLRVANNRLQVSYDLGDTYRDVTNNPVYTKFRWLATTGDTQANNVGRIQASTDEGKTWTNMSNDFTNNLHIKKYIGVNESLPTSGIAEGTIYAKGPYYAEGDTSNDNPIYRLWVYAWKGNTLAWQDNGEFTSITAGIVQETGNSENAVMSQAAVTRELTELNTNNNYFRLIGKGDEYSSISIRNIQKGAAYHVNIINPDWNRTETGEVEDSTDWLFGITSYLSTGERSDHYIIQNRPTNVIKPSYFIIIPSDAEYIDIGIRANVGESVFMKLDIVQNYNVINANLTYPNIEVVGDTVIIKENGFAIHSKDTFELRGHVAYVEEEDAANYYVLKGSLNITKTVYTVSLEKLIRGSRVSFSKAIKKYEDTDSIEDNEIILAVFYNDKNVYNGLLEASYIYDLYASRRTSNLNISFNKTRGNIFINNSKVYIHPDGFSVVLKNNIYYIATTTNQTEYYIFDLSKASTMYLVMDITKLVKGGVRTEVSDVLSVKTIPTVNDVIIAQCYKQGTAFFMGEFKDCFENSEPVNINDELFNIEYYAYKCGKTIDTKGVGTSWFNRFIITHISDTHQQNIQLIKALNVSANKSICVCNTGDDSNGLTAEDANLVKQELNQTINCVKSVANFPYLSVAGNHDVTGLTKQEYFDIVCNCVESLNSNIIWGDKENYRFYGYVDFTNSNYSGNYRIIMLDPIDYDDGLYDNPYKNQYVVFSQKQIDWFIETLIDAANSNLSVITMMHYSFGDNGINFNEITAKPDATFMQDAFMIPEIINAAQNKTSLLGNYPDIYNINNIEINADFSNIKNLDYICHLFGHIHSKNHYQCQKTNGVKYDILMLGEQSIGWRGAALDKINKEVEAYNNIGFSLLEIDNIEKTIYRTSYGAYLRYDGTTSSRTEKIPYRF